MDPFIDASVLSISGLFTGKYRFNLPWFQRAYAWNESHVGRLIDDVHRAQTSPKQRYSIGHIVLAKPSGGPACSLVDGHQRTITLTMIFAVLRDLTSGTEIATRLQSVIRGPDGYHLTPQPIMAPVFERYVQTPGSTKASPEGDIMELTECELSLLANRDHIRAQLDRIVQSPASRAEFAAFLLDRCWVVVDVLEDEDEAWSLLSTEEETGLSLHSSERAKLSLVMAMPRHEQEDAARVYEQAQAIIGQDRMSQLLSHIRTLKVRRRTSKPVEKDLVQAFSLDQSGMPFLVNELLPRAQMMMLVIRRVIGTGEALERNARALEPLSWLDHQMWMPATLHWLATMGENHPETTLFLSRLERLTYLMKIASVDPTDQERRLLALLVDIDAKRPVESMPNLAIETDLKTAALANLRSPTFYPKRYHGLVLRRINRNLPGAHDCGAVDGHHVTVEHILPRKPAKGADWWQAFLDQQTVTSHRNRLGNLAFLSLEDNQSVNNQDYKVKLPVLQRSADRFALTGHAVVEDTWTPEVIMQRTEALIGMLFGPWDLPVDPA